jgi:hypothetical protein
LTSGQGTPTATFSANGNGSGWVKASAYYEGSWHYSDPYAIWVGPPVISAIVPETGEYGYPGNSYSFSLWPAYYDLSEPEYYVDASPAYVWYCYQSYTMIYFEDPGWYYIYVEASNSCGTDDDGIYFEIKE